MVRDNLFLVERMNYIWEKYFPDILEINPVSIYFGRKAQYRLGSICLIRNGNHIVSKIIINGYLRNTKIPQFVIDAVIAHEICHYAHGFSSLHQRSKKYPHKGGVIDDEITKRNLDTIFDLEIRWLNNNWSNYIQIVELT
jgi:hypothetical protein